MESFLKNYFRKLYVHVVQNGLMQKYETTKYIVSWHLKRQFGRVDRAIIESYLTEHQTRNLHIGCGSNHLEGWLNSDYFPRSEKILHLDATERFPFEDNLFDYIFSEHMIEHVSFTEGLFMLGECQRILKDKGRIRISTPDLQFLINLYQSNKSDIQNEYIRWSTDKFIKYAPYYDDTFVINNFVREWGHLFIYDEKTLRFSMERAGFKKIISYPLHESDDETFRYLEYDKRMPEGFSAFESFVLEGTKLPDNANV